MTTIRSEQILDGTIKNVDVATAAAIAWSKIDKTGAVLGDLATGFTAGSVIFAGASGVLSQDNAGLFWDNTNNRLGIGTVSPAAVLHVLGAANAPIQSRLENTTSGTTAWSRYHIAAGSVNAFLDVYSQGYATGSYNHAGGVAFVNQGEGGFAFAASNASGDIRFYTTFGNLEAMRIRSGGNVGIGTAAPSIVNGVDLSANRILHVASASTAARIVVTGIGGAAVQLIDSAAAANVKWAGWTTGGGQSYFRAINDAGSVAYNLFTCDHATGAVTFPQAVTIGGGLTLTHSSAPATPAANNGVLYVVSGFLKYKSPSGAVFDIAG